MKVNLLRIFQFCLCVQFTIIILLFATSGCASTATDKIISGDSTTGDYTADSSNNLIPEDSRIIYFDYKKIKISTTESAEIKIKNYSIYQDIYDDLIILGELFNNSDSMKTNISFTFEFYDKNGKTLDFIRIPAVTDYVQEMCVLPFCLTYEKKENYININEIKIGADYKNYDSKFSGLPVVNIGNFYYENDKLVIEGKVINLGNSDIEDLKIFATFYNKKNQVVFIRQCYTEKDKMQKQETQKFSLELLLDEYLMPFTHYDLEAFFRDSLKV